MSSGRQTIVVGILYNQTRDKVLLCKRPAHVHLGGVWEFPGGKLKQGETSVQALKRELSEEISIQIERAHHLISVEHDYPDRRLTLEAWVIDDWSGEPEGSEGQPLEWVSIHELEKKQIPAANNRIIKVIKLPALYLITPDKKNYDNRFQKITEEFVKNGLRLLQFRSKSSLFQEHEQAVRKLIRYCEEYACQLIYNGTASQAMQLGAHGVHLNSANLMRLQERPLPMDKWVVASCHNQQEIMHAGNIDADFCVLSPVHKSTSHSADNALGWERFNTLARQANIPVYALGGIQPQEIIDARCNHAHGVAMISGIWGAPDPVSAITQLNRI